MYETFDHTADLGLRIQAAELGTLFAEAGLALESVLIEEIPTVAPVQRKEIYLPADDLEYLLFDWLKALLNLFELDHLLLCRFEVKIDAAGLTASAWGETYDPDRHELAHEVKAITYHDLKVQQTDDGWLAEVIVDI
jgi:SHS2 domain-containing protein